MRLIHHFRPLLELGSCKEYCMAAKTPGSTSRRTKKTVSAKPPVPVPAVETFHPSRNGNVEEQIRLRAYEIYLERGSTPGNESEDWLIAEREIRSRAAT